ncbi:MAG: thioredoxin family protein [Anaerovoracaceae bacterium]
MMNTEKKEGGSQEEIKVLGSGCAKCNTLEKNVRAALDELSREDEIVHVSDFVEIASYGVMVTPALVIGKKVVSVGKVLSKEEVKALLER